MAWALALCGCGRIGFAIDAGPDTPAVACAARSTLALDKLAPGAPLVDVPVLVVLDDTRADRRLIDTASLRFLDAAGQALSFDLEQVGALGGAPLVAWVRVPRIADLTTTITACYGGDAPPPLATEPTWTTSYIAVWHLGDPAAADATGTHDGTLLGTSLATGLIGQARSFTAANKDAIEIGDGPEFSPASFTISGWMYERTAPPQFDAILTRQAADLQNDLYLGTDAGLGYSVIHTGTTFFTPFGGAIMTGRWIHLAVAYEGAAGRLYLDGAQVGTLAISGSVVDTAQHPLYLGADRDAVSGPQVPDSSFLDGMLDEVRFEAVARSPAWIAFDVASMRDQLISYGAVQ